MSKCTCKNKDNWWVRQWLAYWHYIGANRTPRRSKSSLIECKGCQKVWRTSAKYVEGLPKLHPTPYIHSLSGEVIWKKI